MSNKKTKHHPGDLRLARIAVILTGLVTVLLSAVSYIRIDKMIAVSNSVHHINEIRLELERAYSTLREVDGALKSFLITNDSLFFRKYNRESLYIPESFERLRGMIRVPALRRKIDVLDSVVRGRDAIMTAALARRDGDPNALLLHLSRSNDDLERLIDDIAESVEAREDVERTRKEAVERLTPLLLLTIQIAIVLILFFAYRLIAKELKNKQGLLNDLNESNTALNKNLEEIKKQKDFIETILDSSFNLIAAYDLNGRFISFNRQCQIQFGKNPEDVLGKTFLEVFPGRENSVAYRDLQLALAGETVSSENYQALAPGRYFQSCTMPVHDITGELNCVVAIAHEITSVVRSTEQLKEINEALVKQKEFAETLLNASVDSICVVDTELRFLAFNKAAMEVFTLSEDMRGKKITDLYPMIVGSKTHQGLLRGVEGIPTVKLKHRSVVVDKTFESFIIPLKASDEVYAVMLIHHDITDFVTVTEELTEKNKELERSNSELEQFAFVASHDLQEPLRKIQTFTSMIMDDSLSESRKADYVKKISASASRMSDLIRNVLDFSKVRLIQPSFEDVDLNAVVQQAIIEHELVLKQKDGVVEMQDLPRVKGSLTQLSQLFSNLIENAVKFTTKPPRIVITWELLPGTYLEGQDGSRDYYKISVSDNGIGFDPKYKDHIFEVFKRLHSQSQFHGTGIGLAICKRVVSNHKGHITVDSQPGTGSTFSVYLPLISEEMIQPA